MRSYTHIEMSGVAPPLPADTVEPRVLSWPLAAAVILGLSVGLWILVYRLLDALFGF